MIKLLVEKFLRVAIWRTEVQKEKDRWKTTKCPKVKALSAKKKETHRFCFEAEPKRQLPE